MYPSTMFIDSVHELHCHVCNKDLHSACVTLNCGHEEMKRFHYESHVREDIIKATEEMERLMKEVDLVKGPVARIELRQKLQAQFATLMRYIMDLHY